MSVDHDGSCEPGVDRIDQSGERRHESCEDQPGDPVGSINRHAAGDQARARVPSEDRSFYVKGVEQVHHVGGEVLHPIAGHRLVGVAVPALGHGDGTDGVRESVENRLVGLP